MSELMSLALKLAKKAYKKGEVPIGAIIVKNGKIISKAYNNRESSQIAINHAEIIAIKKACKKLKSWRLDGCEMYCTLEPCFMCSGAILNARIKTLYFGAYEQKSGSATSRFNLFEDTGHNHKCNVVGGVMESECKKLMQDFFTELRLQDKIKKMGDKVFKKTF